VNLTVSGLRGCTEWCKSGVERRDAGRHGAGPNASQTLHEGSDPNPRQSREISAGEVRTTTICYLVHLVYHM